MLQFHQTYLLECNDLHIYCKIKMFREDRVLPSVLCPVPFCTGKGVFCERLPSFDRQTAEACFDEADRCGRPLVCGFYK